MQLVIPLLTERPFSYEYLKGEHALVLAFQKTSPSKLDAFDRHDERLVRRVLFCPQGNSPQC